MKLVAIICNVVLLAFTCMVLVTDGPPTDAIYRVFSLLLLLIPVLSLVVISRSGRSVRRPGLGGKKEGVEDQRKGEDRSSMSAAMGVVTIVLNVVLFGFACWAIVDQYPHPEEEGVVAYTVLVLLTPILSAVALLRSERGRRLERPSY